MIYGYIRTSTAKQSPDRQKSNILRVCQDPNIKLITETYSGKTQDRPKWKALFKTLKAGDVVYFDEISRMSRNASEGFKEYEQLFNRGVDLIFIKEPYCSTQTYKEQRDAQTDQINRLRALSTGDDLYNYITEFTNGLLLRIAKKQIEQAFEQGEKELMLLSERTKEGLRIAEMKRLAEIEKYGSSKRNKPGRRPGYRYISKKELKTKEMIMQFSKDFGSVNNALSDREIMTMCGVSKVSFYKYKRELKQEELKHE